jgi:hypothetical protein
MGTLLEPMVPALYVTQVVRLALQIQQHAIFVQMDIFRQPLVHHALNALIFAKYVVIHLNVLYAMMDIIKQVQILARNVTPPALFAQIHQQIVQAAQKDIIHLDLHAICVIALVLIVHKQLALFVQLDSFINLELNVQNVINQILIPPQIALVVLMDTIMIVEHASNVCQNVKHVLILQLVLIVLMVTTKKQTILVTNVTLHVSNVLLPHQLIAHFVKMDIIWQMIIKHVKLVIQHVKSVLKINVQNVMLDIK